MIQRDPVSDRVRERITPHVFSILFKNTVINVFNLRQKPNCQPQNLNNRLVPTGTVFIIIIKFNQCGVGVLMMCSFGCSCGWCVCDVCMEVRGRWWWALRFGCRLITYYKFILYFTHEQLTDRDLVNNFLKSMFQYLLLRHRLMFNYNITTITVYIHICSCIIFVF